MKVRVIDNNLDWIFGKGNANYKRGQAAIRQNVLTRLRSFSQDWFADINEGIPWIELLGQKQTKDRIIREIESRVLQTEGVLSIQKLDVTEEKGSRKLNIVLKYTDIYGQDQLRTGINT